MFAPLTSRTLRSTQLPTAAERSAGLRPPTKVKPLPPSTCAGGGGRARRDSPLPSGWLEGGVRAASLSASLRRQCAAAGHDGDLGRHLPSPALDDGPYLGLGLGLRLGLRLGLGSGL